MDSANLQAGYQQVEITTRHPRTRGGHAGRAGGRAESALDGAQRHGRRGQPQLWIKLRPSLQKSRTRMVTGKAAKSIAGGLPLSAVTGRAEIMDSVHVGGLGGTYGGNPVACAAALGAIRTMREQDLSAAAQRIAP